MVNENNTSISICILRLSSIGDVTHVIPIISTLQKKYKDPTITWVIGKVEYELVKNIIAREIAKEESVALMSIELNIKFVLDNLKEKQRS